MDPRISQNPFRLLCILLNILHIYYLSDKYLRFEVTTTVQILVPDELVIPSFTICADLLDIMKWNKLTLDQRRRLFTHPKTNKSLADNQLIPSSLALLGVREADNFGFYYNILELFNTSFLIDHSKNFREIVRTNIVNALIATNLTTQRNFFEIGLTFIKSYQKCFALRLRSESPKTVSYDDLVTTTTGLPWLSLFWYYPHNLDISQYIHDSGHVITPVDTPKTIKPGKYLRFHCETYTAHLLSFPYSTNCRNYSEIRLTSKAHCKQKCIRNTMIDKYQFVPAGFPAYAADKYPVRWFNLNQTEWSFIMKQCQDQCWHKDCSSIIFNCVTGKNTASNGNESLVMTLPPNGPVTQTETHEDMSFVVFTTNILSTLGIWLGVSFLDTGPSFRRIGQRFNVCRCYRDMKARLSGAVHPFVPKNGRVDQLPPFHLSSSS